VAQRTAALQASLEQQRAMQAQLVEASRRSGRADAAIHVLHNVGNALNSVNVSVDLLEGALRQSRLPGLGKVVRMLSDQRGDLPGFFAADRRAQQLPDYLVASTARIEAEHAALTGELGELRRHVDHIKLVVATQQSYAGAPAVAQRTALAAVLDDAVAASQVRNAGGPVAIERSYAAVPEVDIDRHKLLEVIGSLLDRAWHALDDAPADRRIRVRLSAPDAERAQIEIEDSGGGIPADGLVRMFEPAAAGRGARGDLHASACAAGELGGTLVAASDGPGLGARFTLTLPLRPRTTTSSSALPGTPTA
jgi:signal transduction histidine kinase